MPVFQYGISAQEQPSQLELELVAFLKDPPEGLGREEHFWNVVTILWGPKSPKPFIRHPWAEKMTAKACIDHYLGLAGSGSSGKTDWMAVWGIVNWLAAPKDTLVFCTSTSLKESGKRIWGSVKAYYTAAGLEGVGKLVDSLHAIRTNDGSGVFNDKEGIYCIAGEKKDEKDAIGKLIGAKNQRVFLLADELPELTEAIMTASFSNLALNPYFQFIGAGNFKGYYDPFGMFVAPRDGYDSISVDMDEWETEKGVCLHFDGMRSPNILDGADKWPVYNSKNLATHRKNYGPDSAEFWRMCRSFPTPLGLDNVIYSESDISSGQGYKRDPLWLSSPVHVSSLDPSYTQGGDRAIQWLGKFGQLVDGRMVLFFDRFIKLHDEVAKKDRPRDYQMVDQFKENCHNYGVSPNHAAIDSTAGGNVFYSIVAKEWSPEVLGIDFSGNPSDYIVSLMDNKTAKQLYDRRVSELWYVGKEFLKGRQLLGIGTELAMEMKARTYETIKGADGLKSRVELKKNMKSRIGFSPDIADSAFVMLALCRERLGFMAMQDESLPGIRQVGKSFEKEMETAQDLYSNANYEELNAAELEVML